MPLTWYDGVTLTVESALSAAIGGCGVWDVSLWDAGLWGPDETWVDISAWVQTVSTSRAFGREVQAWEAGTGRVVLGNRGGPFSPDNLSGPFVTGGISEIRPLRPIRLRATYGGVTYGVLKGYAEDWIWDPGDGIYVNPTITVPIKDEWARLAVAGGMAIAPAGAGELFGPRVHRLLDAAGHTGIRIIDPGSVTMQATDLASKTADELQLTADSEGGAVYIDADGAVVGERQYALVENARSITVQATFGDQIGELPIHEAETAYGADLVKNIVSYQRVGGSAQVVSDPVSRALYWDRTDPRTDLICETDAQALQLASWKLARFRNPEKRVTKIVIKPRTDPVRLFPQVLGRQVRDLIRVHLCPPGEDALIRDCHISGIAHEIDQTDWTTTFWLTSATPYTAFAASIWDIGTWGASDVDPTAALWFY